MNKNNIDIIIPDLKVGSSCFLMNVSGVFEFKGMLSLALLYTNFDFLYNPENFTVFINPKPAEEYISKESELFLPGNLDSLYHRDYRKYISENPKSTDAFLIDRINPEILHDYKELKNLLAGKDTPLIFKADHFYLYDDYVKKTVDILHYHSGAHSAMLVDLDYENKSCTVIDKFFSFKGEVSLESYKNAINSSYIKTPECIAVEICRLQDMDEADRARLLLKENLERSLEENVEVNGIKYYKNIKAIEMFIGNYERHLVEMMEQKGKYAPQFTNKLFHPALLNRTSFGNLLGYIKGVLDIELIGEMIPLCKEISELWTRTDGQYDKCFLTGKTLIEYKDRLLDTYNEILEKEKLLFDKFEKLHTMLSNNE